VGPCTIKAIYVRFEAFMAITMKKAVYLDLAPCRYCVNRGFIFRVGEKGEETPRARYQREQVPAVFFYPEDGGDTFLRNIGQHNIYTAPHPRRLLFSKEI
jgi:hypothetical protein